MARTAADIQTDIDNVRAAISAIVQGGQSYTINSGGSVRTVTLADIESLRSWLVELQQELAEANDCPRGFTIGLNW